MKSLLGRVVLIRLAILLWCVVANLILPDHVPSGVATLRVKDAAPLFSNRSSEVILGSFLRWDSIHYVNIATNGYLRDYEYVFYPLYPAALWVFSKSVPFVTPLEGLILGGLLLNVVCNTVSAYFLHHFLSFHGYSQRIIQTAIVCFAANPASVFFSTLYTESLFMMLSLIALYAFTVKGSYISCIFFLLASYCRSNGVFNSVIIGSSVLTNTAKYRSTSAVLALAAISCCIFPSFTVNYYSEKNICSAQQVFPGDNSSETLSFCRSNYSLGMLRTLPLHMFIFSPYAYLQKKYWNISFLAQYQFKQLPNFLLASPIVAIILHHLYCKYRSLSSLEAIKLYVKQDQEFPYHLHMITLLVICTCWAHVQVTTRVLLSSNPFVYIALAECLHSANDRVRCYSKLYIIFFNFVGVALHVNYFPWT